MLSREDRWHKVDEANDWAEADGCEGGDFLSTLAECLNRVHYSQDQEEAETRLIDMIDIEIEGFKTDSRIVDNYNEMMK